MKFLPYQYIIIVVFLYLSFSAFANTPRSIPANVTNKAELKLTFSQIQLATHGELYGAVTDYLVSEKLDGVRGFWDGEKMYSRSGRVIAIPKWFVKDFPTYPLDGELWMGRVTFEQVSSLVRRKSSADEEWLKVKFMVFDLPASNESFDRRYAKASSELIGISPFLDVVKQRQFDTQEQLDIWFQQVIKAGGEGLMLHRQAAIYTAGRSKDVIKLKPYYDAEATVIAYQAGKGKFTGMMGALVVKNTQGIKFKLGTGFTQEERVNPPALGSTVTYQYSGLTQKGTPRFARFLRVRFKQ